MSTVAVEKRPAMFTVPTLAQYLGLGERTVYRMLAEGELPSYKIKGARRIDPRDVDRYLRKRKESHG